MRSIYFDLFGEDHKDEVVVL